jgi:hypothetical protein
MISVISFYQCYLEDIPRFIYSFVINRSVINTFSSHKWYINPHRIISNCFHLWYSVIFSYFVKNKRPASTRSIEQSERSNWSLIVRIMHACIVCIIVCGLGRKTRIVGGNVTSVYEYPWLVSMSKKGTFYCAGSVISRRHVLTAAHCLQGYVQASNYRCGIITHSWATHLTLESDARGVIIVDKRISDSTSRPSGLCWRTVNVPRQAAMP